MQHGDLSNVVTPRIVLVFEGALGFLPEDKVERYNALGSADRWYDAAHLWDFNQLMMKKILDLTYRQAVEIEIITYAGPQAFADELEERFGHEGLPIRRTLASAPDIMARRVSYAPDIAFIYDANRETAYMYGKKGRYLRAVHQLGR